MTNGLRMDSTRQRALFQTFSGNLSSKTAQSHISNPNKRKSIPDGTNDSATEGPIFKVLKRVQQNGLEGSSNNALMLSDTIAENLKNHEDSEGECDLYELLEVDYDDDCHSDDSDVMLIENTQKAIVIEDDDVDGGQSNCVSSREGKNCSSGSKTSCDGDEAIEQNTIVIEDDDEDDNRLSSNDRNTDKEEDPNSNNSSIIEYERWMSFHSLDNNDDDRVSIHESIAGEVSSDALDRISADQDENQDDKEEEKGISHGDHNSRGSDSDSSLNSCSVIEHARSDTHYDNNNDGRVSMGNEVNTDVRDQISNDQIVIIDDDDEEAKISKCSKTNGHSSIAGEDDKIIVIDDDDDDEEPTSRTNLSSATNVEGEQCSYTLVDVIDAVETEIPKRTKRESVLLWNGRGIKDWRVHISDDNNGTHFVRIHAPAEQNPN